MQTWTTLVQKWLPKKYPAAFNRIALHVTASNFEYYEVLEYKEFRELIPDILEETIGYSELCPTVLKMHWDILVPPKGREDQTRVIVKELRHLQEEFEKNKS